MPAGGTLRLRCAGGDPATVQMLELRQLLAAAPVAVGPELPVNTTTEDAQSRPAVAADGTGHYLVAWQSQGQDGSGWGVFARRFGADGAADGDEFRVNTETANNQMRPSVAASPVGAVVVWDGRDQPGGSGADVYAQRFDPTGATVGSEFRVNQSIESSQLVASVAMAADGRFVVVWVDDTADGESWGIRARTFGPDGTAAGPAFLVNTTAALGQSDAAVAMAPDGRIVVAWNGNGESANDYLVYARQFAADGTP